MGKLNEKWHILRWLNFLQILLDFFARFAFEAPIRKPKAKQKTCAKNLKFSSRASSSQLLCFFCRWKIATFLTYALLFEKGQKIVLLASDLCENKRKMCVNCLIAFRKENATFFEGFGTTVFTPCKIIHKLSLDLHRAFAASRWLFNWLSHFCLSRIYSGG